MINYVMYNWDNRVKLIKLKNKWESKEIFGKKTSGVQLLVIKAVKKINVGGNKIFNLQLGYLNHSLVE